MKVQSERGQGTTIVVEFKPQDASLAAPAAEPAPLSLNEPLPVAEVKSVSVAPAPALAELSPLLVDNTIEKMIDGDFSDQPIETSEELSAEPPPAPSSSSASDSFSGKIDKPQIHLKKKLSRLDEMSVSVRRPGERA
jgi:hypothetical protein